MKTKEEIQEEIKRIKSEIEYYEREASIRKNDLYWLEKDLESID